ncbi:MAG: S8 family serine peptidase [Oscillatoria princeps RMCB-10]|jgi:subtilisin family serine protease|nr:S8 family serine peptidase [Oscillatoria princeps RMCB-10]
MLEIGDLFNNGYYLGQNPDVAQAVAAGATTALNHFTQFGQFERRNPSGLFDTTFYLRSNPDVANAASKGGTSAVQHFINFGQFEGRNPSALFDTSFYLADNPDVKKSVSRSLTGYEHFVDVGQFEGRDPNALFDTKFYLAYYPDVENAVSQDLTTAYQHFNLAGKFERRDPIAEFNTQYYLQNNPDVAGAVQRDQITGIEHFVLFGQYEGRSPSADFPTGAYLQANPDVAAAVRAGALTAIKHYIQFGENEGRRFIPVAAEDDLRRATNTGTLKATPTVQNAVTTTAIDNALKEVYKFTLSGTSNLNIQLQGLDELDIGIEIGRDIGNDDIIEGRDIFFNSLANFDATLDQVKQSVLLPGTYFIRITRNKDLPNYTLSLSATPAALPALTEFDPTFGNGLVDAKKAVEGAIKRANPSAAALSNAAALTRTDGENFEDLNLVNVAPVWTAGFTGKGVKVAVIDNGVDYNHLDLKRNIVSSAGYDFADKDSNPLPGPKQSASSNNPQQFDASEHGTHVAGIVAAARNGIGTTGVAYEAQIVALKARENAKDAYELSVGAVAQSINHAVAQGAKVINLSLSLPAANDTITTAVKNAVSKGVVVVAAAGNEGGQDTKFPASLAADPNIPGVIAVGAVDEDKQQAELSNLPTLNGEPAPALKFVVAPGVGVLSTTGDREYKTTNGTSQATPHVAGVVALMLQANPNLTPVQVVDILTGEATTLVGLTEFPRPETAIA